LLADYVDNEETVLLKKEAYDSKVVSYLCMSDLEVPSSSLQLLPLKHHEFRSLPAGFGYQHEISEAANTTAFDTEVDARDLRRCVVCGRKAGEGPHPDIQAAHIIDKTEDILVRDYFLL
jgi:hypothetical protein